MLKDKKFENKLLNFDLNENEYLNERKNFLIQSSANKEIFLNKLENFKISMIEEKIMTKGELNTILTHTDKNTYKNEIFSRSKWKILRRKLLIAARFKKVSEDVKLYGAKINFTEIQRKANESCKRLIPNFEERERIINEKIRNNWILTENCKIRLVWNIILLILLFYTLFLTTFRISFIETTDEDFKNWEIFDNIVTGLFVLDIIITLNSSFFDVSKNIIVYHRFEILKNYFKTWMLIDILSIFPFDVITKSNNNTDSLRLLRLPRLYRLLRIFRLINIMKKVKKNNLLDKIIGFFEFNMAFTNVTYFLFKYYIFAHLLGCLWFYIAKIKDFSFTWVSKYFLLN